MQSLDSNAKAQLTNLLILARLFQQKPGRYRDLLRQYENAASVMAHAQALANPNSLLPTNRQLRRQAEADLKWAEKPDHHLIGFTDPEYPVRLKQIFDPPPVLYAVGEPAGLMGDATL
ncbi:MAG: hypothetical protein ACR2PJ_05740, partial [Pseudomonadales bacterium]